MRLAKSGQYTDAFKVIRKINFGVNSELHQRDLWDGVNELMVLDGGPPEVNPFEHQKSKKRIAPKKIDKNNISSGNPILVIKLPRNPSSIDFGEIIKAI